jgi:hypothetical protein
MGWINPDGRDITCLPYQHQNLWLKEGALISQMKSISYGGERGIRTLETVPRLHAFQACAFNHSATSPGNRYYSDRFREFKR